MMGSIYRLRFLKTLNKPVIVFFLALNLFGISAAADIIRWPG
ncbi:MAG: hypothetical protein ABGY96_12955 [bacterium]